MVFAGNAPMLRLSGRFVTSFLAAAGLFAGLGCFGPAKKADPLNLNPDLKAKLNTIAGPGPTGGTKPATFDPTQTGGAGVTLKNSFGRTQPELASSKLPAPQLKSNSDAPAMPSGMAPETAPMAMKPIAMPESTPMSPKLAVPTSEPPVTRTNYTESGPAAPTATAPIAPMTGPLPMPSMGPSLDAPAPLPPPPPSSIPAPKSPAGMVTLPSPVEVPIPGLEPIKLPSAPPIRPN